MAILYTTSLDWSDPTGAASITLANIPPGDYGPNPFIFVVMAHTNFSDALPVFSLGSITYGFTSGVNFPGALYVQGEGQITTAPIFTALGQIFAFSPNHNTINTEFGNSDANTNASGTASGNVDLNAGQILKLVGVVPYFEGIDGTFETDFTTSGLTGTISSSGVTVTGSGTAFLSEIGIAGTHAYIQASGQVQQVSVVSDTSATSLDLIGFSPSISLGTSASLLTPLVGSYIGTGSSLTSQLTVGDQISPNGQVAQGIFETVLSISDDAHFSATTDHGGFGGAPGAVGAGASVYRHSTSDSHTALVFVFDPEEVLANPLRPFQLINNALLNPASLPTSMPSLIHRTHAQVASAFPVSNTSRFVFGFVTERATAGGAHTIDMVSGNPGWTMVGQRQNGNLLVAAAMWQDGDHSLLAIDFNQPAGVGMSALAPFPHVPFISRSYAQIIG